MTDKSLPPSATPHALTREQIEKQRDYWIREYSDTFDPCLVLRLNLCDMALSALSETACSNESMGRHSDRGATSLSVPPSRLSSAELEVLGWRVIHGDGLTRDERDAAGKVILEAAADARGETTVSAIREFTPIGLFWQTVGDGRWHFNEGVFKRGDIHDNGRPIHIALLGEEAK